MQIFFLLISITVAYAAPSVTSDQPTRTQCRQGIITHKPDDSITYQAGSTASGSFVPPADLNTNRDFGLGKSVVIPTEVPLEDYAPGYTATPNTAVNSTVRDSKIYTGLIDMTDGKIRINGEPVDNPPQEQLREKCQKLYPDLY